MSPADARWRAHVVELVQTQDDGWHPRCSCGWSATASSPTRRLAFVEADEHIDAEAYAASQDLVDAREEERRARCESCGQRVGAEREAEALRRSLRLVEEARVRRVEATRVPLTRAAEAAADAELDAVLHVLNPNLEQLARENSKP